ncbi:DUF4097 family beta strand repeat-containing protein [uncultured Muriicola sp.]|uniref:DUF4097 family beta strand repeat-containing protein n=1 Tax=uncultured Muriicola sp. TaxID=1583102 RepID=UPI002614EABB|nr:DUF4097 family beta strand repeat-containing protein [uncultured Muriicola sp.]
MRYFAFFLFSLLAVNQGFGQKTVKKLFLNPDVTSIQIDTNLFFDVKVETSQEEALVLEASIEGEYQKDLALEITENGKTLFVAGKFQPYFNDPNDKLSAHKVVSISLYIRVPENKEVYLYGSSSNVMVEGNYKDLRVVLNDGKCTIREGGQKVSATTQSGPISLIIASGTVKALSKYGSISKEHIPKGNELFNLTSTTGNITITQAK